MPEQVCATIIGYWASLLIERIYVEINPYLNQLKDLNERGQTLRGYL